MTVYLRCAAAFTLCTKFTKCEKKICRYLKCAAIYDCVTDVRCCTHADNCVVNMHRYPDTQDYVHVVRVQLLGLESRTFRRVGRNSTTPNAKEEYHLSRRWRKKSSEHREYEKETYHRLRRKKCATSKRTQKSRACRAHEKVVALTSLKIRSAQRTA